MKRCHCVAPQWQSIFKCRILRCHFVPSIPDPFVTNKHCSRFWNCYAKKKHNIATNISWKKQAVVQNIGKMQVPPDQSAPKLSTINLIFWFPDFRKWLLRNQHWETRAIQLTQPTNHTNRTVPVTCTFCNFSFCWGVKASLPGQKQDWSFVGKNSECDVVTLGLINTSD